MYNIFLIFSIPLVVMVYRLYYFLFKTKTVLVKELKSSYHGGSDTHNIKNLREDMSVTTNSFGTVDNYFEQLTKEKFEYLATHYPPNKRDDELHDAYHKYIGGSNRYNVIFGNGASELIDLILRFIPQGNWRTNDVTTQYREYKNACINSNRKQLSHNDNRAKVTIIVNPNNPTGDFLEWNQMEHYINTKLPDNSYLMVDESMLFWYGLDWKKHSFLGHVDYIEKIKRERNINVVVIQSWTKFFSSTGLRIGSAVIFNNELYEQVKDHIIPWSLNSIARDYIMYAWQQTDYINRTVTKTPIWRKDMIDQMKVIFPNWTFYGVDFVSWIWVDTHNIELAEKIASRSREIGFPIRHGKQGYNMDSYLRIAVRDVDKIEQWFNMLLFRKFSFQSLKEIKKQIVIENTYCDATQIKPHEKYVEEHAQLLFEYIDKNKMLLAAIIVARIHETSQYVIIDGHHRFEVMKRMSQKQIPITVIDYENPMILAHLDDPSVTKQFVLQTAQHNKLLEPKSTKHVVRINDGYAPVIVLSEFMI